MPDLMLPYRTDWRQMAALLDYAKGKGIDRATLEARMGTGEPLRETLNAVEELGLVARDDAGTIKLTPLGQRLAYASGEAERRDELARAMLGYPPYAIPLERALAEGMSVLDAPWVERIWQVDMRLGQPRNRVEEARTFYFRLADEAGLGTYRRGVRGQPTRLALASDAAQRLDDLRQDLILPPAENTAAREAEPGPAAILAPPAGAPVSLSITVDITEWDLNKIEAFLRLIGITGPRRDSE